VLLSTADDEPTAVQAIREGVQDYLIKDQIETAKCHGTAGLSRGRRFRNLKRRREISRR
jgi:PleD family two-component response regulator